MSETFLEAQSRKERSSRGKATEKAVWDVFKDWMAKDPAFVAERVQDGRAGGRPGAAVTCDYNVWFRGMGFAVEIKHVAKGTRLKKFVQYPRMIRREAAGCTGLVIVNFEELGWYCASLTWLKNNEDGASWEFKHKEGSKNVRDALDKYGVRV